MTFNRYNVITNAELKFRNISGKRNPDTVYTKVTKPIDGKNVISRASTGYHLVDLEWKT